MSALFSACRPPSIEPCLRTCVDRRWYGWVGHCLYLSSHRAYCQSTLFPVVTGSAVALSVRNGFSTDHALTSRQVEPWQVDIGLWTNFWIHVGTVFRRIFNFSVPIKIILGLWWMLVYYWLGDPLTYRPRNTYSRQYSLPWIMADSRHDSKPSP